ncbi:MAG: DUF2064 domain-containing protein [Chitinophagales bacterium]
MAHTALLFFSRTAADEATVKTFSQHIGKKGNTTISQYLIKQSLATLQKTNLPVLSSCSSAQTGDSFGERLANAIESVYAKGYQKVIVIGNDCPSISADLLLEVSQELENERLILGPSTDGGVYLIGITKNAYNRQKFIALPWQESNLQSEWQNYANQVSTKINWLQSHFDIDNTTDFKRLIKTLPFHSLLRKQCISILASAQTSSFPNSSFHKTVFTSSNLSLRAP